MKILHTADWHLGQQFHTKKRYEEHEKFLCWLVEKIKSDKFEVLLISGDIYDSSTPSNRAQELYNNFLAQIARTCCRHVVVTGGNHDSPSLLNAQRNVFRLLQIHVVGSAEEKPEDEVLVLKDLDGHPELIVCAVPYLRDRDIRKSEAGETVEEKGQKLLDGIKNHYRQVYDEAQKIRATLPGWVPMVAMGHLFAAGGSSSEGVKDLYIGNLGQVTGDHFPEFDYLALGHLHAPQVVGGKEHFRYSGSPLAMSFGEATEKKEIVSVSFKDKQIAIEGVEIPQFQSLRQIKGDWEYIFNEVEKEKNQRSSAYLEIIYTGQEYLDRHRLKERLNLSVEGSNLQILSTMDQNQRNKILEDIENCASLDDLTPLDVFRRLLTEQGIQKCEEQDLIERFQEILNVQND